MVKIYLKQSNEVVVKDMTITTIIISHLLGKNLSTPSISANPSTRMNMPGKRFSIILLSLISLIFLFVYKKKNDLMTFIL